MFGGNQQHLYPFTAIVGQEKMKTALVLNAVCPEIGGVLIRGTSGTAKSTAVRGLADLLPRIEVVADCPFSCDPSNEAQWCDLCREKAACGQYLFPLSRPRRMVNLPLNATEDRVVGTLDITKALRDGIKALEPGLLARANRGILYIDEINLLDDHIADLLLDAAALGINIVEREGISVSHPARFLLVGTMNPEEGELRPQIADRFGLQVEVSALAGRNERVEVMKRREEFQRDPIGFNDRFRNSQESLRTAIETAIELLPSVSVPDRLYGAIAQVVLKSDVYSHRADITILNCSKAIAAMEGRTLVEASDVLQAATLALGHRVPYDPFTSGPHLDATQLRRQLEDILGEWVEEKKTGSLR